MMSAAGSPWPGGRHGEVLAPDGSRAYLATTAGALAGQGPKWARERARRQGVAHQTGRIPGRQGPEAYFIDAHAFEELGRVQGWWPPTPEARAAAIGTGPALPPSARRRIARLEQENAELERDLAEALRERDELLSMVETLSRRARHRGGADRSSHQGLSGQQDGTSSDRDGRGRERE